MSFFLAVTRRMNDGEMYFVSFETFYIFKAPAAEEGLIRTCIASVGHQLSFFHFLLSCFFFFFFSFYFCHWGGLFKICIKCQRQSRVTEPVNEYTGRF